MLRIKITDQMVEAFVRQFVTEAENDGIEPPTEHEHPDEWARFREVIRAGLQASASAMMEERA